eukprot:scaffold759_cov119-Isochrysis_galbana.AAC.1
MNKHGGGPNKGREGREGVARTSREMIICPPDSPRPRQNIRDRHVVERGAIQKEVTPPPACKM